MVKKLVPRKIQRYGYIRDTLDQRDAHYSAPYVLLSKLPGKVDLRKQCPAVYDQGQLGSCTANAIAGAIEFERIKQKLKPEFTPSRLFIYYNERSMEGTVDSDAGGQLRDGIKSVAKLGDCPENLWPYDIKQFAVKPLVSCYQKAIQYKVVQYQRVKQCLNQIKGCLASGYPFVFGFTVYESFEDSKIAKSGVLLMPGLHERVVGGHAVLAVGYDDSSRCFIIRNSWGAKWGLKGYFLMPYEYIMSPHLCDDFWTIRLITK